MPRPPPLGVVPALPWAPGGRVHPQDRPQVQSVPAGALSPNEKRCRMKSIKRAALVYWLRLLASFGHTRSRRRVGQYLRVRNGVVDRSRSSLTVPVVNPAEVAK